MSVHSSVQPTTKGDDTIAAICTGVGGSISIIRVSGDRTLDIVRKVWKGKVDLAVSSHRTLLMGRITNNEGIVEDECLAAYMPRPNSYTGEDVVEFHGHGGLLVSRTVLSLLLANGCRAAEPGEFTKRAFINGKMDLTQAEAVSDIIQAQTRMALHAAARQLDGALKTRIEPLYERTSTIHAEIEARMDFSDEDLEWSSTDQLVSDLKSINVDITELLQSREAGEILRSGIKIVITGATNAGKSSLLNTILGRNRAIVTDIPGTTRDTLEELAHIRGIPIRLIDTAGIRVTENRIEKEGMARSKDSIKIAQIVLWVIDSTKELADQRLDETLVEGKIIIAVANKIDLVTNLTIKDQIHFPLVKISALTGEGLETLYDPIEKSVWRHPRTEDPEIAINSRHGVLLKNARRHLNETLDILANEDFELVAVNLRAAINALGEITGKTVHPDILGKIFAKFCIGK
jgi:tRNA modification GTPase